MAEIVNLRSFRKQRQRAEAVDVADRNRALHGRSKAEKRRDSTEKAAAKAFLNGHRREPEKQ